MLPRLSASKWSKALILYATFSRLKETYFALLSDVLQNAGCKNIEVKKFAIPVQQMNAFNYKVNFDCYVLHSRK